MKFLHGLCIAAAIVPATAQGVVVSPAKSNGDFIPGTGIPGNNFTATTAGTGESVFLKARGRDTGQAVSQSGNVYNVLPGLAADNVNPWWSFDFQFAPGTTGQPASSYLLTLDVDFDPAVGTASFKTLSAPVGDADASPLNSWDDGGSFATNPGGGAWTAADPFIVADAFHLGFGFWSSVGPSMLSYNPNATGEYEIRLTVTDLMGGAVASTTVFANVAAVPEAGQALMFGLAAVASSGAVYWRRIRR